MNKDKIQKHVIDKFLNSGTRRGSIILPTGVGKTRVSLLIVKELFDSGKVTTCLIVTPTRILKDDSWVKEIAKLEMQDYNIVLECKQTAYKWTDKNFGVIVVDEVHLALSEIHGEVLNIECEYMIGLTATLPSHKKDYLDILLEKLPIIFEISLRECIEMGIIQAFDTYNLGLKLNPSERGRYNIFNKMFEKARNELRNQVKAYGLDMTEFEVANEFGKAEHKAHPLHKIAKSYWTSMSMRKWICYRASAKLKTCIQIVEKYPTKRWIIFSKEIEFVENLYEELVSLGIRTVKYHSKMTTPEKESTMLRLESENIQVLVSAEALTTGYNLPELDAAICASGVSTELSGIQAAGRVNRFKEGKRALMINLYCDKTQEEIWVRSRSNFTEPQWITSINKIKSNADV